VSESASFESDRSNGEGDLRSLEFDAETRELIGLDNIAEILGQIDEEAQVDIEAMEREAQAIKEGEDTSPVADGVGAGGPAPTDEATTGSPAPADEAATGGSAPVTNGDDAPEDGASEATDDELERE